ncbi:hypothetical protein V7O61_08400 [Methanolobus sp. WCC1]|uniref:Uncharacterized protein n=1 Tax=Methanolobus tindarius DSM 2278 TaxID=1090322 RepID=W9DUM5_METTI|nr:hypothetical protein [Methanolobus tindarius]ETA67387.1 hypothetical protein MettiDRAFT_0811 [Methanolobus tindarius DSM 2278]
MDSETAKELLKTTASNYSSEAQKNQEISKLITDDSDSMLDLSEQQIIVMAMYRSFHENVLPLPQTMSFLDNYGGLSRSRDRMGRQEFVECHARRPTYIINPHDTDKEQIQMASPQQPKKSVWDKLRRNRNQ